MGHMGHIRPMRLICPMPLRLVAPVALDAEFLFAAQHQVELVVGAHGVMTGDAGHGLAGALVNDLVPHRVAELSLGEVAGRADLVAVGLEHGHPVRTVHLVAFAAGADGRVAVQASGGAGKGLGVAGLADLVAAALEHGFVIAGVRAVALGAAVVQAGDHVVVGLEHAGLDPLVAGKAGVAARGLAAVAGGAVFPGKGRMQMLPENALAAAAMRIVAGKAAGDPAGEALVAGASLDLGMAAQAEGVGFQLEQAAVLGLVGLVAGGALAPGKGGVRHCRLPGQLLVAGETAFGQGTPEQAGMVGAVGRMALQAFPLPHRPMHLALAELDLGPLVAAVAEFGATGLEQARMLCRVRVVALPALALGQGRMAVPGAEILALMAGEAGFLGQGRGGGKADKQNEHPENNRQRPHQFFLPG